eukprot:1151024-Pelagomonas_calceolata.AAC.2
MSLKQHHRVTTFGVLVAAGMPGNLRMPPAPSWCSRIPASRGGNCMLSMGNIKKIKCLSKHLRDRNQQETFEED